MVSNTTRPHAEYSAPTSRTASLDGCYASDQAGRPVGYHGRVYYVKPDSFESDGEIVAGVPCLVSAILDASISRTWQDSDGSWDDLPFDIIDLSEAVPLCLHCCQPLERSTFEGPGTCPDKGRCFIAHGDHWDDDQMDGKGAWV